MEIFIDYTENIHIPDSKGYLGYRSLKRGEMREHLSVNGQLNWVVQHTQPDIVFMVSNLSKANKEGTTEDMRKVIKLIIRIKGERMFIKISTMGKPHWEVYADASFGGAQVNKSQIGYIIILYPYLKEKENETNWLKVSAVMPSS